MGGIRQRLEGVIYRSAEEAERFFAAGVWIDATAGDCVRAAARRWPDKVAIVTADERITFAAFDERTERFGAGLLDLGFAPGDRILFQMGGVVETLVALFGCFKAGLIPVCTIPQYREIEMRSLARTSGATGYLVQGDFSASFDLAAFAKAIMGEIPAIERLIVARPRTLPPGATVMEEIIAGQDLDEARRRLAAIQIGSEDILSFQLSGGSTGVPKIIPRFHGEYLAHARDWAIHYGKGEDSVALWTLPVIHNAGQVWAVFPTFILGCRLVLLDRADMPEFFSAIERERVTHAKSIGPIAPQILSYEGLAAHDISSLQLFGTLGRADALEERLGRTCTNAFGITEGLVISSPPWASAERRFETNGSAINAWDRFKVLELGTENEVPDGEVGELCFKGPSTFTGYYKAPPPASPIFTSDGFFRTGDLVRKEVIGGIPHIVFSGRAKDNINRGGEKFGAEEVELLICEHPAVTDAKVVPMPDEILGEKACAFIIAKPGHAVPGVAELGAFLIGKGLAKFKLPERIEAIDTLPVTKVGKLDKAVLKKMIADKLEAEKSVRG